MAIIQRDDALSNLPQTLLQMMVQKEQIAQAKEAQKIQQADLKIRQEEAAARAAERAAQVEGGQVLLDFLRAQDPTVAGALPADISGQAAAFVAPQIQASLESAAQRGLVEQQTLLAAEELRQAKDLFGLRQRELEARVARDEAATELDRRRLELEERVFATSLRQAAQEGAMQEWRNFGELAPVLGPATASRILFGTDAPPPPAELASQRLAELEGVESREELVEQRLTRAAGVFGLPDQSVTQLRDAFSEAGGDAQAVIDEIFSQDLDEQTKATLYGVIRSVFPDATLIVPEQQRFNLFRFLRGLPIFTDTPQISGPSAERRTPSRPSGG